MKTQHLLNLAMAAHLDYLRGDAVEGVSVGGCDPCQPFGGSLGGSAYTPDGDPVSVSVGADNSGMLAEIRKLGAQPCRIWGAQPPGGGCVDGCLPKDAFRKYCGKVLPYEHGITSLADSYELKANEWFWPLYWVDASSAEAQITDLRYLQRPVFSGTAPLLPASAFPANGVNLVPGLPAINNTNGMVFSLTPTNGTVDGSVVLRGHFVGIEIISG